MDISFFLSQNDTYNAISLVILGGLICQLLFFVFFLLVFVIRISQNNTIMNKPNEKLKVSVIYFIEKWHDGQTDIFLKNIVEQINAKDELIVLLSSTYMLEGKMLLDRLKERHGNKLQYSAVFEKGKGFELSHLALLTGVRMSTMDYVCFLRSEQKLEALSFGSIVPKSMVTANSKKAKLLVAYANTENKKTLANTIERIGNFYSQALTLSLTSLNVHFILNLHHICFSRKQYLEQPSVIKKELSYRTLTSYLSHIDRTSFKVVCIWNKKVKVTNFDIVGSGYWLRSTVQIFRRLEQHFFASAILFIFSASLFASVTGLVWFSGGFGDVSTSTATELFWILFGLRMILFNSAWIYLVRLVEDSKTIAILTPLFELLFGFFSLPLGLFIWIFKPSK